MKMIGQDVNPIDVWRDRGQIQIGDVFRHAATADRNRCSSGLKSRWNDLRDRQKIFFLLRLIQHATHFFQQERKVRFIFWSVLRIRLGARDRIFPTEKKDQPAGLLYRCSDQFTSIPSK